MDSTVIDKLREGDPVADEAFDGLFPAWCRAPSARHFTPVRVARRAAEMLVVRPGMRVLDVGSGIGKFCIVGALTTQGEFTGVEQRAHLVRAAREVMGHWQVPRCHFIHGNMTELDFSAFDAFYLYNPFAEHLYEVGSIDNTIQLLPAHHERYVRFMEERLEEAPDGTRMVTYHGFGTPLSDEWREQQSEQCNAGVLTLWVKAR